MRYGILGSLGGHAHQRLVTGFVETCGDELRLQATEIGLGGRGIEFDHKITRFDLLPFLHVDLAHHTDLHELDH